MDTLLPMASGPRDVHPSDSAEQCAAEREILAALQSKLGVNLDDQPPLELPIKLDGYHNGSPPVCVEVFAHQGRAKSGQHRKLMSDICKLLLAEKLLGTQCRKIVAVCDSEALLSLENSWRRRFADEFLIQRIVVDVSEDTRRSLREAQKRQCR